MFVKVTWKEEESIEKREVFYEVADNRTVRRLVVIALNRMSWDSVEEYNSKDNLLDHPFPDESIWDQSDYLVYGKIQPSEFDAVFQNAMKVGDKFDGDAAPE